MLTARGSAFLLSVVLMLFISVLARFAALAVVSLTALLWFLFAYASFVIRTDSLRRRLRLRREIWDARGPINTLWAGQEFRVHVALELHGWPGLPYVAATDLVPFDVAYLGGATTAEGSLASSQPLRIVYRIAAGAPGVSRFEGICVRAADYQGFFYAAAFVRSPVSLRVLPRLTEEDGLSPATKRLNLLPAPGVHRLHYPGSGSELLDLRDYMPGDPPRTIAWKVSARRNRLITKEFESEVPVRCTLFVDTSSSVRVHSADGRALTRLIRIAAGVAQANAASRDFTGLVLCDEQRAHVLRPERSPTHLTRLLQLLADAAALEPTCARANPEPLLELAFSFAHEVYPEALRPTVNAMPRWLLLLASFPRYWRRRAGLIRLLYRRRFRIFLLCCYGIPLLTAILNLVVLLLSAEPSVIFLVATSVASCALSLLGVVVFAGSTLFGRRARRRDQERKQMAALLSVRFGLAPGGLEALLEDDDQLSLLTQRFLIDHRVPFSLPYYDTEGRYQFAAPAKVPILADALVRAIGRGRDNELFILLADLLELDDQLDPLLRAVALARSRKHQVLVVCPWPPGMPLPHGRAAQTIDRESATIPPATSPDRFGRLTTARFHHAYARIRRLFSRMGVPFVCAEGDEPVALILQRLDRLRSPGRAR